VVAQRLAHTAGELLVRPPRPRRALCAKAKLEAGPAPKTAAEKRPVEEAQRNLDEFRELESVASTKAGTSVSQRPPASKA
jgi:hypothetical protein